MIWWDILQNREWTWFKRSSFFIKKINLFNMWVPFFSMRKTASLCNVGRLSLAHSWGRRTAWILKLVQSFNLPLGMTFTRGLKKLAFLSHWGQILIYIFSISLWRLDFCCCGKPKLHTRYRLSFYTSTLKKAKFKHFRMNECVILRHLLILTLKVHTYGIDMLFYAVRCMP